MPHLKPPISRTASIAVRLKARGLFARPFGSWVVICDRSARCRVSSGLLVAATGVGPRERRA